MTNAQFMMSNVAFVDGVENVDIVEMLPSGMTPLEKMPRLGSYLGLDHLYVKRDDEGGRGGGGNKLRKFEHQFVPILRDGYDTVIIPAHPQSNAARELVGTAARFGLRSIVAVRDLIPRQTEAFRGNGNRLLLGILGSELVSVPEGMEFETFLVALADGVRSKGGRPYVLPFGASDALGSLGYMRCAEEIAYQLKVQDKCMPDVVVVPTGSCGTQAGLVAGFSRQALDTKVIGFTILKSKDEALEQVGELTRKTLELSGNAHCSYSFDVDDVALGEGYGIPTDECIDAIRLTARLEGLFLDPVYSGKAMAGLIAHAKSGRIKRDQVVVFVHTGGMALLFAYPDAFQKERS